MISLKETPYSVESQHTALSSKFAFFFVEHTVTTSTRAALCTMIIPAPLHFTKQGRICLSAFPYETGMSYDEQKSPLRVGVASFGCISCFRSMACGSATVRIHIY
eukprot:6176649-Pleurochrysis_carterae.AAC.1